MARPVGRRGALALLASPALMGQAPAPVFPPGLSVGLVPPPGMEPATAFSGFQDAAAKASILVAELPATAFAVISKLDDAALRQRAAITVLRRRSLKIGGAPALLLAGTQAAAGAGDRQGDRQGDRKWVLVAGAPALTAMVTVQVPAAAARGYPDGVVEAALATVAFRQGAPPADALAALPFTLGDLAGFRVVRALVGGSVLLTEGRLDTDPNLAQPRLIVSWQRQPPVPPALRESYARRRLEVAQLRDPVYSPTEVFQQGGDWLLIEATGADFASGRATYAFQALLFAGNGVLQAFGLARAELRPAVAPRFRKVALAAAPR